MDDQMRRFKEDVDAKFETFEQRVSARFDGVSARFDSLEQRLNGKIESLQQQFSSAKVWALGLYIGLAATLLLVMAKGFKWI
jgi:hypothetical protein